jgi:hypothetical protein
LNFGDIESFLEELLFDGAYPGNNDPSPPKSSIIFRIINGMDPFQNINQIMN